MVPQFISLHILSLVLVIQECQQGFSIVQTVAENILSYTGILLFCCLCVDVCSNLLINHTTCHAINMQDRQQHS